MVAVTALPKVGSVAQVGNGVFVPGRRGPAGAPRRPVPGTSAIVRGAAGRRRSGGWCRRVAPRHGIERRRIRRAVSAGKPYG